jgi:hypothetical protein
VNCAAESAVVASSTRRRCVMMISGPRKNSGNRRSR